MYINKLNEFMLKNLPKLSVNILTFKTNKNILKRWIPKVDQIITVEENILDGGFGSSILEFINIELPRINTNVYRVGLPNKFIDKYGTQDELHKIYNLDKKYLINVSRKLLYKK